MQTESAQAKERMNALQDEVKEQAEAVKQIAALHKGSEQNLTEAKQDLDVLRKKQVEMEQECSHHRALLNFARDEIVALEKKNKTERAEAGREVK